MFPTLSLFSFYLNIVIIIIIVDSTLTLQAEPVEGVFTLQHTPANHASRYAQEHMSGTEAAAESALLGDVQPQQTFNT